jgi:hypothetical protein
MSYKQYQYFLFVIWLHFFKFENFRCCAKHKYVALAFMLKLRTLSPFLSLLLLHSTDACLWINNWKAAALLDSMLAVSMDMPCWKRPCRPLICPISTKMAQKDSKIVSTHRQTKPSLSAFNLKKRLQNSLWRQWQTDTLLPTPSYIHSLTFYALLPKYSHVLKFQLFYVV